MSISGTLGAEEELHLFEPATGALAPNAPRLLRRLPSKSFSAELQRSTVEMNTATTSTLQELHDEIVHLRAELRAVAAEFGLAVASVGMAPQATDDDFELTMRGRFSRMHEEYRLLVDEQLICGYQVHVGVDDRDLAVRVTSRLGETLPVLLALSASSPFWRGRDTGYASMRTMIWQRWPTSGGFDRLETMEQYEGMIADLVRTGVISDAKMAYFDVRPSTHVPTLELRTCDACPLVDDAVLIAGLFRAAVAQGAEDEEAGRPLSTRPAPVQRAALWRAARSGLGGELLGAGAAPQPRPSVEVVRDLVARLRPQLEAFGDWETVNELAEAALVRGCSASRQRTRYAERGKMTDVVRLLVEETASHHGSRPRQLRCTTDYPASLRDEAVTIAGTPTAAYRRVFEAIDAMSAEEVARSSSLIEELAASNGLTFGVAGSQRPFPLDLVPRIIAPHEWSALADGLVQRARAIEAFLRDVYGPARIVADGVLDPRVIRAVPGWRDEGRLLPADAVRCAVIGFDLVREPISGWRVLEDNVRVPSGVGYAVGMRRVLNAVVPELAMGVAMRAPEETIDLLGRTLRACARGDHDDPVVALISDGAANSAWYEHRTLAEGAGLLLAEPGDVTFERGRPVVDGQPLDVAYLRLEHELADLVDTEGRAVGQGHVGCGHPRGAGAGERARQRRGRRQGDVLPHPRRDRLLPGREPAPGPGAHLSLRRSRGVRDRARPPRGAGDQAGRRLRRRRRAGRTRRHARSARGAAPRVTGRSGALGGAGDDGALDAADARGWQTRGPPRRPADVRLPDGERCGGGRAGRARAHPGRTRPQHDRQLLPGRGRQGHLDPDRRADGGAQCAESSVNVASTVVPRT